MRTDQRGGLPKKDFRQAASKRSFTDKAFPGDYRYSLTLNKRMDEKRSRTLTCNLLHENLTEVG